MHNVKSAEWNQGFPFGVKKDMKLENAAVMNTIKCDVHPWMSSYVGIVDNPYYAVSDESGAFTIAKLPAGKYTIAAVHPTLGEKTAEITVAPGQTATATFDFTK